MQAENNASLNAMFANQNEAGLFLDFWQTHSHETGGPLPSTGSDLVLAYWQFHCQ